MERPSYRVAVDVPFASVKALLKRLLGLSPGAVVRGLRFGFAELARVCLASYAATKPLQSNDARDLQKLPCVDLDELLGKRHADVQIRIAAYEDGMLHRRDAIPLIALLLAEQPRTVVEIGTFMGHTTRLMAENLREAKIHTIDLPEDYSAALDVESAIPKDDFHLIARRVVGREFRDAPVAARIVQHFADTAKFDFSQIVPADFFFIDGSHTYEYCKSDSEKCLQISTPGATFLWHDCDEEHTGVVRFLREWQLAGRDVRRIAGTALAWWKRPVAG